MKGILSGTHFNRCKQIHVATATAIKILHFTTVLEKYEEHDKNKLSAYEIVEILEDENKIHMGIEDLKKKLQGVLDEYSSYARKTLDGSHGYTAKFALMYASFDEIFQIFEYAIRTSDNDP